MDKMISQILTFKPRRLTFPFGWCGHIPFAAWLMKLHRPEVFVELGTHSGNSYFSFCQAAAEYGLPTRCYAVDTWQGDEHSGGYSEDIFIDVAAHNAQHYAGFSNLMRMRFDQALAYFSDASVDLLHIDGLHTYEAVKSDFESWLPKLSDRGIVLFHDINVREREFGVWQVWEELSAQYPHCAFFHSHGLGVLIVGSAVEPDTIDALQVCNDQQVRTLFAGAADALLDRHFRSMAEEQVHVLQAQLHERSSQLSERAVQVDEKTAQLDEKTAQLNEKTAQLNEKTAQLDEKTAQLEVMRQRCAHAQLTEELAVLQESHQATARHAANLAASVENLKQSLSWRITAPLRWAAAPLTGLGRKAAVVSKSIELGGGIGKTAALTVEVLRKEGPQGVKWRLKNAGKLTHVPAEVIGSDPEAAVHSDPYHEWLRRYDPTDDAAMAKLRRKIEGLETTFSVVMPVYNPPIEYLRQAIESVQAQVYPHWELCIADDASPNAEVRELLSKMAKEDARIKLVFREKNGHISAASNSALEAATGDFVVLMDNDDLLPPHALAHVALAIKRNPSALLIYSDEDKVDENNRRYDAYFKCEYNYELFLAQNMISHLGVYKRSALEDIEGFRVGLEGAQDWDLAFRIVEKADASQIVHIPRVLYHWRAFAGSTALAVEEKSYVSKAQIEVVKSHLIRVGKSNSMVSRSAEAPSFIRVQYALPTPKPKVSIVIPTKDRVELLRVCVESIFSKTQYDNYEVIVVDNDSEEGETLRYFDELRSRGVKILDAKIPFNYSKLNNMAVQEASGDYICLMNNDIEIINFDWLDEMLGFAAQPDIGCVGARLWYPDGTLQHAGVVLGVLSVAGHVYKGMPRGYPGYFGRAVVHQSLSAVTAACLLVRKKVYEEVNGLDEALAVAFNDIDFCIRVRERGYRNVWTPYAEMVHHESASRGLEDTENKKARFKGEVELMQARWGHYLKNDPAYNPNLSLTQGDFSLAWPSRIEFGG